MRIAISGSHGLIGSALAQALELRGDSVLRLVRERPAGAGEAYWDPKGGTLEAPELAGVDAVVHLAGEPLTGRWTEARKREMRESRVQGTRLLSEALAKLAQKPRVLVSASAMGYYGDRGEVVLTEDEPPGRGFLAEMCKDWEAAAKPARDAGIRVVNTRNGLVLSDRGGALKEMLGPFKLGLGGTIGPGDQYWSWIGLDDHVRAILHVIETETLEGPVNFCAPPQVTNREFTKALGNVLDRPTFLHMPAFAARMAFGEMADEMLLPSARMSSGKLQGSGFQFRWPNLEEALRYELGKDKEVHGRVTRDEERPPEARR